ncbi:hypothetical protein TI05_15530 [Achromatium sp. WMS3]|nr:hypothetical protein TI05_15530 [Achromatium sp. WMS3]
MAIDALKQGHINPDLILLDILMPGLSGYDVMDFLQENDATGHIPVIFLTSMDDAEDEKYGLLLGAVDYIPKPISAPVVLAHVKEHLENNKRPKN